MNDLQVIDAISTRLEAASTAASWGFPVIQKNQSTQEGIPRGGAIFFEKLFDDHYGFPALKEEYRQTTDDFLDTETQIIESTFQISALLIQKPEVVSMPTASDVVNYLKLFIQSRHTIAALAALGISMMRVTKVRNPYSIDDRQRFEASPSFDIILQYTKSIQFVIPAVQEVVGAPSPIPNDPTVGTFPVLDFV